MIQYLIVNATATPGAKRMDCEAEAIALAQKLDCIIEVRFGGDLISARPDGIIPRTYREVFGPPAAPCGGCGKAKP